MEQIRSFIAIELPLAAKVWLKQVQDSLSAACPAAARWVNPENIHLTLKFLGNVAEDKLAAISEAMLDSAQGTASFELRFNRLGAFPNLKKVQVVWVGLSGEMDVLEGLYQGLEGNLESLGFPPEGRAFTPHLTLARVRETASPQARQNLGEMISQITIASDLKIRVDSINLMRSQLNRQGAIYTCLKSIGLKTSD